MDYLLLFAFLFIAGTLFLIWRKQERYLLFFMVRTKYFTPMIDWVARLAPGLWKFLADLSVVVSFGGLGAAYLTGYRKESRNLDGILFLFGLAAIVLWWQNALYAALFLLALIVILAGLSRLKNPIADFLYSFAAIALVFIGSEPFLIAFLNPGASIPLYIPIVMGAFGIPLLLIVMFVLHGADILVGSSTVPGAGPILPTVSSTGEVGFGVPGLPSLFIPFVYAVISFIILLGSHEFAHGVLARVHGIKIKSTGLLTFGIVPIGAFVEPDESELEKRPSIEKMRVFSAGSFANLMVCVAGLILFIGILFIVPSITNSSNADGVTIIGIADNSSAKGILQTGMVINGIDGKTVKNVTDYKNIVPGTKPGTTIDINTDRGDYKVVTMARPENLTESYLNIDLENHLTGIYGPALDVLNFVSIAIGWVIFFNINIALVNVLPVAPFDGWRMLREVMAVFRISEKSTKKVVYAIVAFSLLLLLINMLPLFDMIFSYLQNLFFRM